MLVALSYKYGTNTDQNMSTEENRENWGLAVLHVSVYYAYFES